MSWSRVSALILTAAITTPAAFAQQTQRVVQGTTTRSATQAPRGAERWARQLEMELEHLQEDLHYERGSYPAGLSDSAERASQSVTHFHHVLRRSTDRQHLMRDFQEMDSDVHQVINLLEQSGDSWLNRQAQRIRYADEQLHYAIRVSSGRSSADNELLARHARLLASESQNLRDLAARLGRRDNGLRESTQSFADEAQHFYGMIEQNADREHLREDFRELDNQWHRVVNGINQSGYGMYLRRTAQNVDRVHNQIHDLMTSTQGHQPHDGDHQHEETRETVERQRPENRQRVQPQRERPAIEVEIPGIGRFRIPR